MKRLIQTFLGCMSMLSAVAQGSFTPGNLVVLQTSGTLSKASSTVTLKEFTTSGTAGATFTIPSTGPTPLQSAGVFGGSEGFLTTSADGKYLVIGGYATAATITDITATTASSVKRAVGLVYPSGFYLQYDTTSTFYSANDIRGAISDGTNFWASGASSASVDGIDYFGPGAHAGLATGAVPPKAYGLRIFNGQIYFSTQKAGPINTASQLGIFALGTGLPTGGTVTVTQIINTGTVVPADFSFSPAGDICYIAVNLNTAVGGIQKWTKTGSVWSMAYTLGTGITNTGAYGLVVDYSGTFPTIYATTFDATGNRVIKITDNGSGATATTIVAATANVYYKGISFAPVASGTPVVNLSVSRDTASEAGVSVITVTANASAPVSGSQTVALSVSGTGITSGDYTLSNSTITIPAGATSGSVTFTVVDDILGEGTEIANLAISAPSAGIVLGMRPTQHITIADNDGNNHPVIVMDATTTNFIDGGTTSPVSPYKLSGVIGDPTDPTATLGINFRITDLETPSTGLTMTVASSDISIVPGANIVITGTDSIRNIKIIPAAVGFSDITIKVSDGIDSTLYIINYGASAASATPATTVWHTGMSDASDAISQDDNYYISGDDELNVLNVYSRSSSGLPVVSYNYTSNLALPDLVKPEVDLEAATVSPAHANRTYWLGSMSNGKLPFDNKPNRDRIFATTYSGTGASTTFSFSGYTALKTSLLAWGDANGYSFTASAAAGVDSKLPNGFAAEGMVFGPDNTTLYIGLRAPLVPTATRTNAVIAPILNFETWFNDGAPSGSPAYGSPIELDLGGRGIRDMIRISNGSFVIIAGNPASDPITSAIYKWTGNATDAPILVPSAASGVLNMEGVMQINTSGVLSTTSLQVITDDGGDIFYNDGTEAKDFSDLNYRKFRSDIVSGIDLTYPEINLQGNGVSITDGTTAIATTNNTDFGNVAYGTNTTKTFVIQNAGTAALHISGVSFTGSAAGDYGLVSAPVFPVSIAVNGTYTITVQFSPHAIGARSATINIMSDDADEATYNFNIRGNGTCNTPSSFTVSGGGTLCSGGAGVAVFLSSSTTGVNYQLYNGATAVGGATPGSGSALNFGLQNAAGTYTVLATDAITACTANMTASATITVNPLPGVYAVTGGGNYCSGGTGVVVGLGNSQSGINYQLYSGATAVGGPVTGTGSALSFGNMTLAATYSVTATNTLTACVNNMSGSASVTINPLPSMYSVTGGGSYCTGGTGVHVGLGGSSMGVRYKLYMGAVLTDSTTGSGMPLDFGLLTAMGTYSILATDLATSCMSNMPGSAIVATNPVVMPLVSVTASTGAEVCSGTSVSFVATAVNGGAAPVYQWRVNGVPVATASTYTHTPVNGDVVTVKLTSNATCVSPDSAIASMTMTVDPYVMPSVSIVAVPGNILCAGSPVTFVATPVYGGTAPVYTWIKNSTVLSATGPTYSYIPVDGDEVILSITSDKPCASVATVYSGSIKMEIAPLNVPGVTLEANPGSTVVSGTAVTITAKVVGGGSNPAYKWIKNGSVISGETGSTYTSNSYANNDSISCVVTGSNMCGSDGSGSIIIKTISLSVAGLNAGGDFVIQPNPNSGDFYIKGNTLDEQVTINVVNVLGQNVHEENIKVVNGVVNQRIMLNNTLPGGVYLLSVYSNSGSNIFRITVNR